MHILRKIFYNNIMLVSFSTINIFIIFILIIFFFLFIWSFFYNKTFIFKIIFFQDLLHTPKIFSWIFISFEPSAHHKVECPSISFLVIWVHLDIILQLYWIWFFIWSNCVSARIYSFLMVPKPLWWGIF